MIQEIRDHNLNFKDTHPKVHCPIFEDNSRALEMANIHKLHPRPKHLAVTWHHFRHQHVEDGSIPILPISTDDQTTSRCANVVNKQSWVGNEEF
jgi:hypothetical protein